MAITYQLSKTASGGLLINKNDGVSDYPEYYKQLNNVKLDQDGNVVHITAIFDSKAIKIKVWASMITSIGGVPFTGTAVDALPLIEPLITIPTGTGGGGGGGGDASAANQTTEIARLTSILNKLTADPSTATAQSTGNNSLNSIDFKTPAPGQKTSANSSPVVIASDQSTLPVSVLSMTRPLNARVTTNPSVTTTAANITTANALGYRTIIQSPSTATASVYLKFDGTATTASYSIELTPGSSYQTTDGFPDVQAISAISTVTVVLNVVIY